MLTAVANMQQIAIKQIATYWSLCFTKCIAEAAETVSQEEHWFKTTLFNSKENIFQDYIKTPSNTQ